MRREILYRPLASQLKFHHLGARFKGFSGPVGSGKSQALCQEALRLAYVNGGRLGLIGAPTYRMLEDVTQMRFLEFLDENAIPYRFAKSSKSVYLEECGSRVLFRSMDQPQRLVGTNLAWFCLDELTYSKYDSWRRMVARLRDPKARELRGAAVWTPKGFDWVYDLFIKPGHKDEYGAVQARPYENRYVGGRGYYESLGNTYDERFFAQEALGEYLNVQAGQVYYAFDRKENVKDIEFDPRRPLCWSLDFNRMLACSVLGQIVNVTTQADRMRGERTEHLNVIEEMALPDTPTEDVVREFLRRVHEDPRYAGKVAAIEVFGDATGSQSRSESNKSNWQQVKSILAAERRGIPISYHVDESNPLVSDRVVTVLGLLRNRHGERRLFVDRTRCPELIADFEQVTWKADSTGMSMHKLSNNGDFKRTHASDSLGYLAHKKMKRSAPVWSNRRVL